MCDLREVYWEQGFEEGFTKGIKKAIAILLKLNYEDTFILTKVCETFHVSQDEASGYLNAIKASTE